MNKDIKNKLDLYLTNCLKYVGVKKGEGFCVGIGVNDPKDIDKIQNMLNVKFSIEYINFLKIYGECCVEGFDLYGIPILKSLHYGKSVIDVTRFYKEEQGWPGIEDWYVVSDNGGGNPIGIDPEGAVWLSDHDSGFEKIKLADDFEEFLLKLLEDRLYD